MPDQLNSLPARSSPRSVVVQEAPAGTNPVELAGRLSALISTALSRNLNQEPSVEPIGCALFLDYAPTLRPTSDAKSTFTRGSNQ